MDDAAISAEQRIVRSVLRTLISLNLAGPFGTLALCYSRRHQPWVLALHSSCMTEDSDWTCTQAGEGTSEERQAPAARHFSGTRGGWSQDQNGETLRCHRDQVHAEREAIPGMHAL